MSLLIIIGLVIIFLVFLPLRIIICNFRSFIIYALKDTVRFINYKRWNLAPVGFLHAYTGLFGQGKTLSSVNFVYWYFNKYNNKKIYDTDRKCFVTQYVNIISNVDLKIPYIPFISLSQIVEVADSVKDLNEQYNARFVTLVLGDEFSVQLNSRKFKENLDPLTLSAILTCRHHGISMLYTAQRFQHVDALLRQVTEKVIECRKIWRIQCLNYYDAWQLEQTSSSLHCRIQKRKGFFATDEVYNQYDTLAVVKNLIKDYKAGEMLPEDQILLLQQSNGVGTETTSKRKRKRKK